MAILMMTRVRMRTVLSPPGAPLFCSLKLLDRETSLQVCNVLLKIDQSLKKILKTRSKSKWIWMKVKVAVFLLLNYSLYVGNVLLKIDQSLKQTLGQC